MNRLRHMRCYLAGPMDRVPDGGETWRNQLIPFLAERGVAIFNPCNKPISEGIEDAKIRKRLEKYKKQGKFDKVRKEVKLIRHIDLRMVDVTDFTIVNIDLNHYPCGTDEEWVTANRSKKPIIFRCEQGKKHIPGWLFGVCPPQLFFSTWDAVKKYLDQVDTAQRVKTYNRWVFFDYSKIIFPVSES